MVYAWMMKTPQQKPLAECESNANERDPSPLLHLVLLSIFVMLAKMQSADEEIIKEEEGAWWRES